MNNIYYVEYSNGDYQGFTTFLIETEKSIEDLRLILMGKAKKEVQYVSEMNPSYNIFESSSWKNNTIQFEPFNDGYLFPLNRCYEGKINNFIRSISDVAKLQI